MSQVRSLLFVQFLLLVCASSHGSPAYPLFAINESTSQQSPPFSASDLQTFANNFIAAHGDFTKANLTALHAVNPNFIALSYVNTSKTNTPSDAIDAERDHRANILHHRIATLTNAIDASATSFQLTAVSGVTLALKASKTTANLSVQSNSAKEYVVWLRIDNEFMKITGWNSTTKTVTVTRGFASTTAAAHSAGKAVLAPVYCSPNSPDGSNPLRYQIDPYGPLRWDEALQAALDDVNGTFDGTWYDILGSGPFNEVDMSGNSINNWWDVSKNSNYTRDDFRLYTEIGIDSVQDRFFAQKGFWPILFGNNMVASSYPVGSGGRKLLLMSTAAKPRPIDGYCIESFAGNISEADFAK